MSKKTLMWETIERRVKKLARTAQKAERAQAELLQEIRDGSVWKDRKRFASNALYLRISKMSFRQVVKERLHLDPGAVLDTLRVLDAFGGDKMERYGRAPLLRMLNRTDDQQTWDEVFRRIEGEVTATAPVVSRTVFVRVLNEIIPGQSTSMVGVLQAKLRVAEARIGTLENEVRSLLGLITDCPHCSSRIGETPKRAASK
jgi:hypothetical protein